MLELKSLTFPPPFGQSKVFATWQSILSSQKKLRVRPHRFCYAGHLLRLQMAHTGVMERAGLIARRWSGQRRRRCPPWAMQRRRNSLARARPALRWQAAVARTLRAYRIQPAELSPIVLWQYHCRRKSGRRIARENARSRCWRSRRSATKPRPELFAGSRRRALRASRALQAMSGFQPSRGRRPDRAEPQVRGQSFLVIGEAARILCIRKMNEAALLRAVSVQRKCRKITTPGRRVARNKPRCITPRMKLRAGPTDPPQVNPAQQASQPK